MNIVTIRIKLQQMDVLPDVDIFPNVFGWLLPYFSSIRAFWVIDDYS